jgi:hypothetical protein
MYSTVPVPVHKYFYIKQNVPVLDDLFSFKDIGMYRYSKSNGTGICKGFGVR